jgi:hypothetical protein
MYTLPHHFNKLLENIYPPEERIKKAETIPGNLRTFLKEHDGIKTVDPYSRLAGSYARKTYVGDIKDVDLIILIDEEFEEKSPNSVLRLLKNVLEDYEGRGDIEISHQRRSIHMFFKDYDFHLDIVPALIPEGIEKALIIPDKPKEKWVKSHPLGYGKELSELNGKKGQKVIPLIRLLKHWRDYHMQYKRPKSYWLECMVYNKMNNGEIGTEGKSLSEVFNTLTDNIYKGYEDHLSEKDKVPWIKDPMLGNNVARNWERSHFESFMERLDETRKCAQKALKAEEKEEAIELWQKIFGKECFPSSVEESAKILSDALKATSAFVTPMGRVERERPSEGGTIIQPHRSYGE